MYIASAKRKENIAEYLLYMWQVEDIIRAYGLDIDRLSAEYIGNIPGLTDEQRAELRGWYESLIDMMRREDVANKGHLQINRNVLNNLADLHHRILNDPDPKFDGYKAEFHRVLPIIVDLRSRSGEEKPGEIEACFNVLYGLLLLRMSGKDVTQQTQEAAAQVAKFMALLAKDFHLDEEDKLFPKKDDKD